MSVFTTINNLYIGNKVQLLATGSNCNIEYDKCIGIVSQIMDGAIDVDIKEGFNTGTCINFKIGGHQNFSYIFIPDEWDL